MSAIAQVYANLIKNGHKTINDVPKDLKKEVKEILGGDAK